MPGVPRRGAAADADAHVRLRPRGVEPDSAERHRLYRMEGKSLSYAASDAALTVLKKDPELAFLNEVSSVPLQQALRHQHKAFGAFFAGRARYPRFKSRRGKQSATYTRSAFSTRNCRWPAGEDERAAHLRMDVARCGRGRVDPTSVTVSRDPCGRWYVCFAVEVPDPEQLPATGAVVGVDLGIKDSPSPPTAGRSLTRAAWPGGNVTSAVTSGGWLAASRSPRTGPKPGPK